ncbi:hypothetical protein GCM10027517_05490 [Phycicoccus ginsengisoli]
MFGAAHWPDSLWNSHAKAVSVGLIEWQCATWGSGRGGGDWVETAAFHVAAAAFDLATSRNLGGHDELVVSVPLHTFSRIATVLHRLGDEVEDWPWFGEGLDDDPDGRIEVAACELGLAPSVLAGNEDLLESLRIR